MGTSTTAAAGTTFLLARHGATAHTAQGRLSGCTGANPPLSRVGREQARRLAAALRAAGGADVLACSPVLRARQTAEEVAAVLDLPLRVEDDLREIDFGDWEGLTPAEVDRRWPGEQAAWRRQSEQAPPGGESVEAVGDRVARVRERLAAEHPGARVLLVSHMYPVKLTVVDALAVPRVVMHRMHVDPTGLGEVRALPPGDPRGPWLVLRHNDAAHLRDAPQRVAPGTAPPPAP
ncbi:histidine phosphatase family protein [Kineococcus indalonis]|uniref:histidine phosphatase family protein n=1 Tax=Kineococcus indalonis TaxID=2696566 RepID=UPI001412E1AF|nr:histidine phosphatase family protein [Kineococcus indalonis]NAZ88727.1 histidine phosphatase family protein [Kineococcus indalonis]